MKDIVTLDFWDSLLPASSFCPVHSFINFVIHSNTHVGFFHSSWPDTLYNNIRALIMCSTFFFIFAHAYVIHRRLTTTVTLYCIYRNMELSVNFGTPVNTALLLYILYSIQRIIFPPTSSAKPESIPSEFKAGYSWMPKSHPPTLLYRVYTPKTLEPFNGKDDGRILLAIDGIVFDVTAGRNFYGPSEFFSYPRGSV